MTSEIHSSPRAIAVVGPTASGKTRRAVSLADAFNGEIVSCDSRQVYRGMDIGTGKDLGEYGNVRVHLLDVCEAGEKYNLFRFIGDARDAIKDIRSRGKRVILCGGSGMYVENLLSGISLPDVPVNSKLRESLAHKSLKELAEILRGYKMPHNTTDVDTTQRAIRAIEIEQWYRENPAKAEQADRKKAQPMDALIIGVDIPREIRRERIAQRLGQRIEEGMIEEVRHLLENGVDHETLTYYGLEYKFVSLYLQNQLSLPEMQNLLLTAIHQFAKRQMTWLRGMERRGFHIHWLPHNLSDHDFREEVNKLL